MPENHQVHANRKHDFVLIAIVVVGLASVVGLSRIIDARRPAADPSLEEEKLYVTANTARRVSLGFNGLIADWYWMRSLQYVGHKVLSLQSDIPLDDLGSLNLKLLAPLLDTATTLDPAFMEPYEYAAIVLPGVDVDAAIRLTQKGIAANPGSWKLYYHLGYIYWQRGDFLKAAETFRTGSQVPGAPPWMKAMEAKMTAEGGSRTTAREIYRRMLDGSEDPKVKDMAALRLMQLDSLDQRDAIRKVLASYKELRHECPRSWPAIAPVLQSLRFSFDRQGSPLDPTGSPYILVKDGCDVDLDPKSAIPYK
jgi:hypothetical protein